MKKNLCITFLICFVLLIITIGAVTLHNDSTSVEIIERNGQSYSLFPSCAEKLGYNVDIIKKEGKPLDGQKTIEYQYFLKDNDGVAGSLSIAVCAGEIFSTLCEGDVVSVFNIDIKKDIVFFDNNAYISTQIFTELQESLTST